MAGRQRRRWLWWLVTAVAVVVVLAVAGPFVYIHLIEGPAPAPFRLRTTDTGRSGSVSLSGTWTVASGSEAGYRVKEVLFGQDNTAVGRTRDVTGKLTIKGTTVTAGSFTVRMATVTSDQGARDAQFRGRIMNTSAYPTGVFTLTRPIRLAPVPAAGVVRTYMAAGTLKLHGHTRGVSFPLSAKRTAASITVSGSIPVVFARWGIPNPSLANFVTTQNHGLVEFLLTFRRS